MNKVQSCCSNVLSSIKIYLHRSLKVFLSFKRYLKVDIIFAILFVLAMIAPTISAFTRNQYTIYGYAIIFVVYIAWFVSCIIRNHKRGKRFLIDKSRIPEVTFMVIWLIFLTINVVVGRGENGYWAIIYTIMFMTIYMIDYLYCIYNERHVLITLAFTTLLIYGVYSLLSIFMLHKDPFIARYFNALYFENIAKYAPYEIKGLGSYSFFTALSISLPVFVFLITKSKHRIISTILYLLCVAGCFYSAYAGLMLLVVFTVLAMLIYALVFYRNKKRRKVLLTILTLTVVLIICLFSFILPHDTNEMYKAKIRDLLTAASIDIEPLPTPEPSDEDGDGIVDIPIYNEKSRFEFYQVSMKTIQKHPLFGVGPFFKTKTVVNGIGGHSSWLDYLAMYGFIGCAPLILFFIFYFRRTMKMSKYSVNKVMRFLPWALFMGYGLLNPVFTARNFPVTLMLLTAGALPCGVLIKFKDVFRTKKLEAPD